MAAELVVALPVVDKNVPLGAEEDLLGDTMTEVDLSTAGPRGTTDVPNQSLESRTYSRQCSTPSMKFLASA